MAGLMAVAVITATTLAHAPAVELDAPTKTEHVFGTLAWPTPTAARTLIATCTGYTWTGNRTRTGTWPRFGTVAVDPTVIPLGSRLLIEGFPGTVFVAEDTGGGVRGYHVDIYLDSRAEAIRFGRQSRTVQVLR